MKKKLIITESQLERLKQSINENSVHSRIVKRMKEELDANYAPISKVVREGGDYSQQPMIEVKVDGEAISVKDLYEYMRYKYKVSKPFTQQVIKDWVDGKITDDYRLSKNISTS